MPTVTPVSRQALLAGKCGSIDIGSQTISWNKYGTHISSDETEINLTVNDSGQSVNISLDSDKSRLPKNVKTFLNAATQQSFILRRRTLLRYVDARSNSDRYQAIEEFLNLDSYQQFEEMLKKFVSDQAAKLKIYQDSVRTTETTLRNQLNIPSGTSIDESSCIAALNAFLSLNDMTAVANLTEAQQRFKDVERSLNAFKDMDAAKRLFLLSEKTNNIPEEKLLLESARLYSSNRLSLETEEAKLKGKYYDAVLRDGVKWIKEENLKQCPLCHNDLVDLHRIISEIEKRIKTNEALTQMRCKSQDIWNDYGTALVTHYNALKDIKESGFESVDQELSAKLIAVTECLKAISESRQIQKSSQSFQADINALSEANLDSLKSELTIALNKKKQLTPDYNQYSKLQDAATKLTITITSLTDRTKQLENIDSAKKVDSYIRILHNHSQQARKNAVQKLLDIVAEIAHGYLTEIHSQDEIGNPKLKVTARGSASVELSSKFHGELCDPRGYYSEGHVDSLGLCLFLAIRRLHYRQQPQLALLVLDDVLHSVDGEHRLATANLIFKEFSDHQIIITTHDPLWFENLKMAQRAQGNGRTFKCYRISDWSIDQGPMWGDHLSDYEWLCSEECRKGKPADRVVKAGRLLEQLLRNLCHNLGSSVSFDIAGRYTVDPLWIAFLKSAKKNEEFYSANKEALDAIDLLRQQRNWIGAHWNDWAQQLTDPESKQFSEAVVTLRNAVYCKKCNAFIKRIGDLNGVWSCPNQCLKYSKQ